MKSKHNLTEMGTVRSSIRMLIPLNKQEEALEILEAAHARVQSNPSSLRKPDEHLPGSPRYKARRSAKTQGQQSNTRRKFSFSWP